MAKKRRTRKEKVEGDIRHQHTTLKSPYTFSFSEKASTSPTKVATENAHATPRATAPRLHFEYLSHDLIKTGVITASVLVGELILLIVTHGMK